MQLLSENAALRRETLVEQMISFAFVKAKTKVL